MLPIISVQSKDDVTSGRVGWCDVSRVECDWSIDDPDALEVEMELPRAIGGEPACVTLSFSESDWAAFRAYVDSHFTALARSKGE